MMKRILNRISHRNLRRICGAVLVLSGVATGEVWSWNHARAVLDGNARATYWFAADGSASCAFDINMKNRSGVPLREIEIYDGIEPDPNSVIWYDQHGATLQWRSEKTAEPNLWRQVAELHTPAYPGEWVRYTVWNRHVRPVTIEHGGLQWGIFQDQDGNWVFRNNPGLRGENTVTLILPQGAEIVSAEPANRARIISCATPAVTFTNLTGPHVVKWKLTPAPQKVD